VDWVLRCVALEDLRHAIISADLVTVRARHHVSRSQRVEQSGPRLGECRELVGESALPGFLYGSGVMGDERDDLLRPALVSQVPRSVECMEATEAWAGTLRACRRATRTKPINDTDSTFKVTDCICPAVCSSWTYGQVRGAHTGRHAMPESCGGRQEGVSLAPRREGQLSATPSAAAATVHRSRDRVVASLVRPFVSTAQ
jgi:hypothetical protein